MGGCPTIEGHSRVQEDPRPLVLTAPAQQDSMQTSLLSRLTENSVLLGVQALAGMDVRPMRAALGRLPAQVRGDGVGQPYQAHGRPCDMPESRTPLTTHPPHHSLANVPEHQIVNHRCRGPGQRNIRKTDARRCVSDACRDVQPRLAGIPNKSKHPPRFSRERAPRHPRLQPTDQALRCHRMSDDLMEAGDEERRGRDGSRRQWSIKTQPDIVAGDPGTSVRAMDEAPAVGPYALPAGVEGC